MIRYRVKMTSAAVAAISAQARYIAVESQELVNAERWLEGVWAAVDSLEYLPKRAARAEENAYVEYEVRQLVIGSHLLLYSVDDDRRTVWIVGLRHGHRFVRPGELPGEPNEPEPADDT